MRQAEDKQRESIDLMHEVIAEYGDEAAQEAELAEAQFMSRLMEAANQYKKKMREITGRYRK